MASTAMVYASFLLRFSAQVLATPFTDQADGIAELATAESTTDNMTASLEAAVAMVAAWPPALCAARASRQVEAPRGEAELFCSEPACAPGHSRGRSASAADEGWGVGLTGVNTLDGNSVAQPLDDRYVGLLRGSGATRATAGSLGRGTLKQLRPVSFSLRENHNGRTLVLPLGAHLTLPLPPI